MKFLVLLSLLSSPLSAQEERASKTFDLGGFIDLYYSYDNNQPEKRLYTTQPVKHNDVSLNLGHIEGVLKTKTIRGRFALQTGDSIHPNYATEPNKNIKHVQEAYVGYRVSENTWIDGGIFFSHLGIESWISRDNWTYSRSLTSDFFPYYSSGLRVDHEINENQNMQFLVLNGWSNITEGSQGIAIGFQFSHQLNPNFEFVYGNFFGNEKISENQKSRYRVFHNFNFMYDPSDKWKLMLSFDIGKQAQQKNDGINVWNGSSFWAQRIWSETDAMGFRLEWYNDPHQSNVEAATPHGFQVVGASTNYDRKLYPSVLWRTELRGFYSRDEIFPSQDADDSDVDAFLVTSLALSF